MISLKQKNTVLKQKKRSRAVFFWISAKMADKLIILQHNLAAINPSKNVGNFRMRKIGILKIHIHAGVVLPVSLPFVIVVVDTDLPEIDQRNNPRYFL